MGCYINYHVFDTPLKQADIYVNLQALEFIYRNWVTHIVYAFVNQAITDWDNGLSSVRHQANIWTNVVLL